MNHSDVFGGKCNLFGNFINFLLFLLCFFVKTNIATLLYYVILISLWNLQPVLLTADDS